MRGPRGGHLRHVSRASLHALREAPMQREMTSGSLTTWIAIAAIVGIVTIVLLGFFL